MECTIRKALPEEAYDYVVCHTDCWSDAYRGIIPDEYLDDMHTKQDLRADQIRLTLQQPEDGSYYCAIIDGRMAGRLIFGNSREEDMPDAGEIHAIYLLARYWDQGFGRQMLDFALDELRQAGHRKAFVWVIDENERGRRFYEKNGFLLDSKRMELELGCRLTLVRYVRCL